jgi:hypothetical protein
MAAVGVLFGSVALDRTQLAASHCALLPCAAACQQLVQARSSVGFPPAGVAVKLVSLVQLNAAVQINAAVRMQVVGAFIGLVHLL